MQERLPTTPRIFTYLGAQIPVHCYEHLAVVTRGGRVAAWAAEFVQEGLRDGHRCCCLAPAYPHSSMVTRLLELGVDVERHLRDRTLQFPPAVPEGDGLLVWAKKFFADAEGARVPAVRWLEEGVGAKPAGISVTRFFELHARLNYLVKQYPSVVLCQYDAERLEMPHLFSAIAVHRHLLVEGTLVRDNPFYLPAEKFLSMTPRERERDLRRVFREVGSDLGKLLTILAGYGQLQQSARDA